MAVVAGDAQQTKDLCIVVSFVDDFVTQCAFLGQYFFKRLIFRWEVIRVHARLGTEKAVDLMVAGIEDILKRHPGRRLKRLEITGHGYPAAWARRLTLEDLQDENGAKRSALLRLQDKWGLPNDGVVLRMCSTARAQEGRSFLEALALAMGSKVSGWTGVYEIYPTGEEWTATPLGQVHKTNDTRRVSYFHWWKELPGYKRWLALPVFLGAMSWRTLTGR